MKVFLVRAGKLSTTLDYAIHLLIDKSAEQVRMRFGLRHRPDSGLTPDFEVNGNSYQVVESRFSHIANCATTEAGPIASPS